MGSDGMIEMVGSEWAVILLGHSCRSIDTIIVDTNHYKGNFPESFLIEYSTTSLIDQCTWKPLVKRTKLGPHAEHEFTTKKGQVTLDGQDAVSMIRITMYPDGGISRLRIFGSK